MKNCNEAGDVVGDSCKRYRARGQGWEDPDRTKNQSERRIRYRALREKIRIYVIHQPGGPYWEKLCPPS